MSGALERRGSADGSRRATEDRGDSTPTMASEIARYLQTGETDPYCSAWRGNFFESAQRAKADLRQALVDEVSRLTAGLDHAVPMDLDLVDHTGRKVTPMVTGLFPRSEQPLVLAAVSSSVVFLTKDTIEGLLLGVSYHHSAWSLANMYLMSLEVPLLGPEAPRIVGMNEGTTCYVSMDYFTTDEPFADFIVHEVAHIFHNCKRETIGLPATRRREWLLDIAFGLRETFAYSCEAYSQILERARTRADRLRLAAEHASGVSIDSDRADQAVVADIVAEAVAARNGWKVILRRCAPPGRSA